MTICHRVKILVDDRSVAAAAAAAGPFCGLLPVSSYWIRRGRVGENGRIEPILTVRTYLWFCGDTVCSVRINCYFHSISEQVNTLYIFNI